MIENLRIHGDQIGRFETATINVAPGSAGRLTLHDVRVMGRPDAAFVLEQERSGRNDGPAVGTYRLLDEGGNVIASGLTPDISIKGALATGARHILLRGGPQERILVDLNGLPGSHVTMTYSASGDRFELPDHRAGAATFRTEARSELTFVAGTRVTGAKGRQPIESLRPGALVWTLDQGLRPLNDVRCERVRFGAANGHLRPICIPAAALGRGCPSADLRLAPHQRVLVTGWRAELFFGREEALMPANALLSMPGIAADQAATEALYYTLVFDSRAVIETGGIMAEGSYSGGQRTGGRPEDACGSPVVPSPGGPDVEDARGPIWSGGLDDLER